VVVLMNFLFGVPSLRFVFLFPPVSVIHCVVLCITLSLLGMPFLFLSILSAELVNILFSFCDVLPLKGFFFFGTLLKFLSSRAKPLSPFPWSRHHLPEEKMSPYWPEHPTARLLILCCLNRGPAFSFRLTPPLSPFSFAPPRASAASSSLEKFFFKSSFVVPFWVCLPV